MQIDKKPLVAITIGDVTGIGPEIVVKAINDGEIFNFCNPLVIGDYWIMKKVSDDLKIQAKINIVQSVGNVEWTAGVANMIDMNLVPRESFHIGKPNGVTGKAMIEYTKLAVNLALENKVHGSVGGPHSKKAADEAGIHFTGYPYLIADMTGDKFPFLMLVAGKLRVTNVTLHVSLRKALELVKKNLVLEAIKATEKAVQTFGVSKPKIAVSGLNPHAGEEGMFGDEDEKEIRPAIEAARSMGIDATGPFPADSLFYGCMDGRYDGYVAMYHDQAHLPVKVLAFKSASAVAIGVPINWATVDHGCALDIAWKNVADPNVIIETIKLISTRARIE
jgi:4-phospho-D-threonate 3-dehydrogenase / 4-phospho-D-erythronate 3-dehydrogenase